VSDLVVRSKEDLQRRVDEVIDRIKGLSIENDEQYTACGEWVKRNKETQRLVTDWFEPARVNAKAVYDAVLTEKNQFIKPLEESEKILRKKMSDFITEKERLRREEIRRKEEEARRLEEEKRLRIAEELVSHGKLERADAMLEKPINVHIEQEKPAHKMREVSVPKITDKAALLRYIAEHAELHDYVEINLSALMKVAPSASGVEIEKRLIPVL